MNISKNKLKLAVWAVFPAEINWRGEGIAQTIEDFLNAVDTNHVEITLFINKAHFDEASKGVINKRIKIYWFGVVRKPLKKFTYDSFPYSQSLFEMYASNFIQLVKKIINRILWILIDQPFYYIAAILKLINFDATLMMSPNFTFTSKFSGGKKITCFWDPFPFEYEGDTPQKRNLLRNFANLYIKKSDLIITQSSINNEYLVNVLGVEATKICTIVNGCPDYSNFVYSNQENKIYDNFPLPNIIYAKNKKDASFIYAGSYINKSVLFRLEKSKKNNDYIFMLSTQYRFHKGIETLFSFFDYIKRNKIFRFKIILTCNFNLLTRKNFSQKYFWYSNDCYELSRLNNEQHAYVISKCNLLLHPSYVEGGPSMFPSMQAASLGIPSLINIGRHTEEIKSSNRHLFTYDFEDFEGFGIYIKNLLSDPEKIKINISALEDTRVNWEDSANTYIRKIHHVCND